MPNILDRLGIDRVPATSAKTPSGNHRPRTRKRFDPPPPWEPFPVDSLPDPIRKFVQAGSRAMGCDHAFIALPLLAGLASAIGATRRIRLKPGWSEPAVIWAAVVAESGTMKSPAQSLALGMLTRAQDQRLDEHDQRAEEFNRDRLLHEADMASWRRNGRAKGEPAPAELEEPQPTRYLVSDITIEALAGLLENNPRGLLVGCDELASWLGSFDQYRGGRGGDASKWLSIHRAEGLIVDRKTGVKKTVFVKRAAVSVAGSIQPKTLHRALGGENFENGLAARLLVAAPPTRGKKWTEATVDRGTYQTVEKIFHWLLELDFKRDQDDQPAPIDIDLSPEAKAVWVDFYNTHSAGMDQLSGRLRSAHAKLEAYAARLALVVHLADVAAMDLPESAADTISETAMTACVTLARWFTHEADRVYRILEETEGEAEQRKTIELITRNGGKITANDLRRRSRKFQTSEDAERFLIELVAAGVGTWKPAGLTRTGGRPTRVFCLYPVSPYPKPP